MPRVCNSSNTNRYQSCRRSSYAHTKRRLEHRSRRPDDYTNYIRVGRASLRIYNYVDPLPIFYTKSYNRWRGKPFAPNGSFHLNSKGFNDVEFSAKKVAGTTRILGIGDSFAFGIVPYEYNYLTLIEQNLKQSGHNVEVINMGIPSIGPREYLSLLVNEGLALNLIELFFLFSSAMISRRAVKENSSAILT